MNNSMKNSHEIFIANSLMTVCINGLMNVVNQNIPFKIIYLKLICISLTVFSGVYFFLLAKQFTVAVFS